MALRFFNIGKANSEIDRLLAENEDLKARVKSLEENESTVAAEASRLSSDLDKTKAELAATTEKLAKLQAEGASRVEQISKLTKDLDAANATIKDPKGAIEVSAERKAQVIIAEFGGKPASVSGQSSDQKETFESVVRAYMTSDKSTYAEAFAKARASHKHLFAAQFAPELKNYQPKQ